MNNILGDYMDLRKKYSLELHESMEIESGAYCKCECGYKGYVYGTPHGGVSGAKAGISAPWCPNCKRNNKLEEVTVFYTEESATPSLGKKRWKRVVVAYFSGMFIALCYFVYLLITN
jgi:hypothetical protein